MTRHSLVTGGAGFIGSHLVEAILARGDRVAVIDDESTGTRANLAAVIDHPRLRYVQGSVADRELVRGMLDGVDEVYHLAAAVGVRLIAESPIHTIETNVYPMELLLDELGRLHAAGRTVRSFLASTSGYWVSSASRSIKMRFCRKIRSFPPSAPCASEKVTRRALASGPPSEPTNLLWRGKVSGRRATKLK